METRILFTLEEATLARRALAGMVLNNGPAENLPDVVLVEFFRIFRRAVGNGSVRRPESWPEDLC